MSAVPCQCGSADASWRGDIARVYCCERCWGLEITPEKPGFGEAYRHYRKADNQPIGQEREVLR